MFDLYCNCLYFFICGLFFPLQWNNQRHFDLTLCSVTCWLVKKSFLETGRRTWDSSSWLLLNSDGSGFLFCFSLPSWVPLPVLFERLLLLACLLCFPFLSLSSLLCDCLQLCSVPSCVSLCNQSHVVSSFPLWRDVFAPCACLCIPPCSSPLSLGFSLLLP